MIQRVLCFAFVITSVGCARPHAPLPAASSPALTSAPVAAPAPRKHREVGTVHRLDFVLSTKDQAGSAPPTSFSLVVEEGNSAEVFLSRREVGLKVKAQYRTVDEAVLIDVGLEMNAGDTASTSRKIVTNGSVLAANGKSAVVVAVDDDRKRYELAVVPTKLR
jgi:hypothetical protein